LIRKRKFEAAEKFEDGGKLDKDLQRTAYNRSPRGDDDERVLRAACTKGDHAGDHGDVPENGRGVGEKEFSVAVEDAEAPGGGHEESCAGEKDADENDGEFALFTVKAGGDGVDEPGRGEDAEKDEEGSGKRKKSSDGAGGLAGFFLVIAGEKVGVDGDERGGEDAFAKKILQEIRNAKGGFKHVRGI